MHVGVWAPMVSERLGGGYTIENDLFQAILAEGHSTQHRFTALVNPPAKYNHAAYPTLVLPKVGLIKGTVQKLVKRIIRKSRRVLRAAANTMGVLKANHSAPRIDDLLARNGIEFIISLIPDQNPYEA